MSSDQDAFSIVVQGAMSPPVHHPLWYADAGILTRLEADQALRSPSFSCTADFSDFALDALRVQCSRERWLVRTTRADALGRMLRIAVDTYDRLNDTLVMGFGLNFDHVREVDGPDVPRVLARVALSAPLGLEEKGAIDAAIQYRCTIGSAVMTVTINPAESPRLVEVKSSYVHELQELAVPRLVALGSEIRSAFPIAKGEAEAQLARTLRALRQVGRV